MSELKPCPFCGSAAERRTLSRAEGTPEFHYITCPNPKCSVAPTTDGFAKKGSATRVWNRRVGGNENE